jgi:hypothetical protein
MNHLDEYDIVYLHKSTTDKHKGDLFNLFFTWQYSVALQMAIDENADEM